MATTEERLLTYLVNSKNGEQLPVLVNVQGSEFFIIYNPSTDRFEKVLISTLLTDDLIIDALGYTPEDIANKATDFTVKNDDLYPSTKSVDDFITFLKSNPNGLASTDADGKIPASLLPAIAITSVIPVAETTIADFAANSGSYTFEQGDVLILDNGNGSYYMYNGGTKTDVSAYNEITASAVTPNLQSVTDVGSTTTNPLTVDADGMAVAIKGSGAGTRAFGFENTAADSYYFEQVVSGSRPPLFTTFRLKKGSLVVLEYGSGGNSPALFKTPVTFSERVSLNGDGNQVNSDIDFNNQGETYFIDGYKIGDKVSGYMKVEGSVTTNRTATFQDKDGTIAYLSDITAPNRTMDNPTTQTSTSLNSAFPFAENPVGTTVTNLNALQLFMYVRISELLWRVITLGTTI